MITAEDILNMNFYKKEKFTGSYKFPAFYEAVYKKNL